MSALKRRAAPGGLCVCVCLGSVRSTGQLTAGIARYLVIRIKEKQTIVNLCLMS